MEEPKIEMISEDEAQSLPSLAEIRFDCLVRMYDMGIEKKNTSPLPMSFQVRQEKPRKPQWFRSLSKFTLEEIRNSSEGELGTKLKFMLRQLELHIDKYMNY